MPMAMPSAVRALRSRRVRRPTLPVARTSRGRRRLTGSAAAGAVRGGGAGAGATMVLTRPPPPASGSSGPTGRSGPSCRSGTTAPVAAARSSDCRRPSRRVTQRGSEAAMPWSWVMRTMVEPERCSAWKVSRMSAPVRLSRLPVGSSASSRSGSWTMARAMATRWRSPPESCPGPVRGPVSEPDLLQRLGGSPAPTRRRATPVGQPERHVLQGVEPLDEVELLEHEADGPAPEARQLPVAQARRVVPGDADGARGGAVERADQVEQRALARARGSDDGDHLTRLDLDADPVEGPDRGRTGVLLHDVDQLEHRTGAVAAGRRRLYLLAHARTTSSPSASVPVTSTKPSANSPSSTATSSVAPPGPTRSTA